MSNKDKLVHYGEVPEAREIPLARPDEVHVAPLPHVVPQQETSLQHGIPQPLQHAVQQPGTSNSRTGESTALPRTGESTAQTPGHVQGNEKNYHIQGNVVGQLTDQEIFDAKYITVREIIQICDISAPTFNVKKNTGYFGEAIRVTDRSFIYLRTTEFMAKVYAYRDQVAQNKKVRGLK